MPSKQYAAVAQWCVACGCCVKVCPLQAIHIWKGVTAQVNADRCVGCGRCVRECPAQALELVQRRTEE